MDVTALTSNTRATDVTLACTAAMAHECRAVCVNPCYVASASAAVHAGPGVLCASTIGFPFGCDVLSVKVYAAEQAVLSGAEELDLMVNIGALLSDSEELVQREIAVVQATQQVPLTVTVETSMLSEKQIALAAVLAKNAGAKWIKAGTGLAGSATPEQIHMLREAAGEQVQIAAQCTVQSISELTDLYDAGARRFCIPTPCALALLRDIDRSLGKPSPELGQDTM